MDLKKARGREIALRGGITKKGKVWLVPSQTRPGVKYKVTLNNKSSCTCRDFTENGSCECKHIHGARIFRTEYPRVDLVDPVPNDEKETKTYRQDWPSYNAAQTQEKRLFNPLLAELCKSLERQDEKTGAGRPPFPLKDLAFLAISKVYEGRSARRFMSDVHVAHQSGYISRVPHFNSVINGFRNPSMTDALLELIEATSLPLANFANGFFAADSSGLANSLFVKWQEHKDPKKQKQHGWTKIHIMCGVNTHIITAVVIKDKNASDTAQLPELVKKTAKNFDLKVVCADKAYGSLKNYKAIMDHGAVPYIPFKSNQTGKGIDQAKKPHPATPLWKRMHNLFSAYPEEFNAVYHERSNVEAVFSMLKRTLGGAVRSKDPTAKLNEALCMVVCHNIRVLIKTSFEAGLDLGDLLAPKRTPQLQAIYAA
jgi:hypothetical protein